MLPGPGRFGTPESMPGSPAPHPQRRQDSGVWRRTSNADPPSSCFCRESPPAARGYRSRGCRKRRSE
eukprot:12166617-Alexandrium_andersonii.AAC.1